MFNLKKFILLCISIAIVLGVAGPSLAGVQGMEPVAENEHLILFLNPETTEVAVYDKGNDKYWYTNPPDRDEMEHIARGGSFNRLGSQFTIDYYYRIREARFDATTTARHFRRDNYNESIDYEQFEISNLDRGVRVEYTVNEMWNLSDYFPDFITKESMDEKVFDHLSGRDKNQVLDNYNLFTLVKLDEGQERIPVAGLDKEKAFGEYTILPLEDDYLEMLEEYEELQNTRAEVDDDSEEAEELEDRIDDLRRDLEDDKRDVIWDFVYKVIEHLDAEVGVAMLDQEHISGFFDQEVYMSDDSVPGFLRANTQETFKDVGFTPEDVNRERLKLLGTFAYLLQSRIDLFVIPIEYILDGKELVVRVPTDEIDFPREQDVGEVDFEEGGVTIPVHAIHLLPYFGAANTEDEGYIFVPDGSGGLINLNNERTNVPNYNANVYGRDHALRPREEQSSVRENIHLPLFGLKKGEQAFIGIIEEGDTLAMIRADVAGRTNSYNTVSAQFTITPRADVGLGGGTGISRYGGIGDSGVSEEQGKVTVHQERPYQGNLTIRYGFLAGEEANYSGMANYYRSYLKDNYELETVQSGEDIPFILEAVGTIPVKRPIMGIPREVNYPLTTFEQVTDLTGLLQQNQIENLQVRYSGWLKGGLYHNFPRGVILERSLGSEDDFMAMRNNLADNGVNLFPEVSFLNIYRDEFRDGFRPREHASRFMNRFPATVHTFDMATLEIINDRARYILSPSKLSPLIDGFVEDYRDYGNQGLSVKYMGRQLNSDFRRDRDLLVDRQQASEMIAAELGRLSGEEGMKIMAHGADAYTLPYVSIITNTPIASSSDHIIDRNIPFYQMALHGLRHFAGEPINLAQEYTRNKLHTIETGGNPYFVWSASDSSVVKGTDSAYLYSLYYQDWLEEAVEFYHELNDLLGDLQNKEIVAHREIQPDVYATVYENDETIIVNYNTNPVVIGNTTVEGEDYVRISGGLNNVRND